MQSNNTTRPRQQQIKQQIFLAHFRKGGLVSYAAESAGISRQLVYYWCDNSSAFAKQFLDAKKDADEAHTKMALDGLCEIARRGDRKAKAFIGKEYGASFLNDIMQEKFQP